MKILKVTTGFLMIICFVCGVCCAYRKIESINQRYDAILAGYDELSARYDDILAGYKSILAEYSNSEADSDIESASHNAEEEAARRREEEARRRHEAELRRRQEEQAMRTPADDRNTRGIVGSFSGTNIADEEIDFLDTSDGPDGPNPYYQPGADMPD